jgi:hypothetical protein
MYNRPVLAHWRELGVMPSLEERVAYLEGAIVGLSFK